MAEGGELRQKLIGAFALDDSDERFMDGLNEVLAGFEEKSYTDDIEEALPNLFVVGAPRSGTTLLLQLMASHLEVGWISNLAAAFWAAPCSGIRLHRRLLGDTLTSSFDSRAGRTSPIAEPHEFGYFWTRLLGHGLEQPPPGVRIDWQRVRRTLLHMDATWGRPIAFKAFQLGYHVQEVVRVLPRSVFVHVVRDPIDTAGSLLRTRRDMTGSDQTWISLRPRDFERLSSRPPAEQVVGQVLAIESDLNRQLDALPAANVVKVPYESLCGEPRSILERLRASLELHGHVLDIVGEVPKRFEPSHSVEEADRATVEAALERARAAQDGG